MSGRKLIVGAGALAAVAVFLVGCPAEQPIAASRPAAVSADSSPVLASLGDQTVRADELKLLFAQLPEQTRQQLHNDRPALEAWIRARLAEKALYQQAEAKDWSRREDVQQQIQLSSEQIVLRSYLNSISQVPDDYPGEQELQQAYDAGKGSLKIPALYRLSQIFLAVPDEASASRVLKQAQALSKQARAPGTDFAELARSHSEDTGSAQVGGDTGLQPLAQLLPEVRSSVQKLAVGAVSEPLQSSLGWHIVKLTDSQPARVARFDEVREQLRQALRTQRQEQLAKAHIEGMLNNATLSIEGAALNEALGALR